MPDLAMSRRALPVVVTVAAAVRESPVRHATGSVPPPGQHLHRGAPRRQPSGRRGVRASIADGWNWGHRRS